MNHLSFQRGFLTKKVDINSKYPCKLIKEDLFYYFSYLLHNLTFTKRWHRTRGLYETLVEVFLNKK